jgi:hypothetical protein
MGAGTVIFEGVGSKPKRNRGPQKARSIAEISILLMTGQKNHAHNIMCELNKKPGVDFCLFQEPGQQINVALKQGLDQYFLVDNFKHISRSMFFGSYISNTTYAIKNGP